MSDARTDPVRGSEMAGEAERRPVDARRNWLAVARKDFRDAGRSWQLYALGAVFLATMLIGGLQTVLRGKLTPGSPLAEEPPYAAQQGMADMASYLGVIIPLVVLVLVYSSIVVDRERGSLRVLLAYPVTRRDVVLGTFLGRVAVVWAALLVGLAPTGVLMWILYDSMNVLAYAGFGVSILLYSAVFVAMAVGISAAARTRGQAIAGAVTAYALISFLWRIVLMLAEFVTGVTPTCFGLGEPDRAPGWYVFLERAVPDYTWQIVVTDWVVPVMREYGSGDNTYYLDPTTPGPEPFYLDTWVLALVLVAWGVVPLAIGYWRFQNTDIG